MPRDPIQVLAGTLCLLEECELKIAIHKKTHGVSAEDGTLGSPLHFVLQAIDLAMLDVDSVRAIWSQCGYCDISMHIRRQYEVGVQLYWAQCEKDGWARFRQSVIKQLEKRETGHAAKNRLQKSALFKDAASEYKRIWKAAGLPQSVDPPPNQFIQLNERVAVMESNDPSYTRYGPPTGKAEADEMYLSLYGNLSDDVHGNANALLKIDEHLDPLLSAGSLLECVMRIVRVAHKSCGWDEAPVWWAQQQIRDGTYPTEYRDALGYKLQPSTDCLAPKVWLGSNGLDCNVILQTALHSYRWAPANVATPSADTLQA